MKSKVAEEVRRERLERELAMTPAERVRLAFELGERDLVAFMAANRVGRDEALRILEENKQKGRKASRCAARRRL